MKNWLFLVTLISGFCLSFAVKAHQADSYKVIEVTDGGTIIGKVSFKGEDPPPTVYTVTKDMDICGTGTREIDYVKVNDEGRLSEVVVYLEAVNTGKPFSQSESEKVTIEQKECDWGHLLKVITVGQPVEVVNVDQVSHKMHAYEMVTERTKKSMFTLNQSPENNQTVTKTVDLKQGTGMMMQCDQHEFMQGFMFVAKNPYYAVVAEDGTFTIADIPAGQYTFKAWHGKLKDKETQVSIENGKTITVDFEFSQ